MAAAFATGDVASRALENERLRNLRVFNVLRFLGVSTLVAVALAFGLGVGVPEWRGTLPLAGIHWAVAAAVFVHVGTG